MIGSLAYFLSCCSMLFMLSNKFSVNLFETASSSSGSRIFLFFFWSWRLDTSFTAPPQSPLSILFSVCVGSTRDSRVHTQRCSIAGRWVLGGHSCIHLGRSIVLSLLPELDFLQKSHFPPALCTEIWSLQCRGVRQCFWTLRLSPTH